MTAEEIYRAELVRLMLMFMDGEWHQLANNIADVLAEAELMNDKKTTSH